jgi:D-ribose pyranose/furanose isomerase RbsD
MVVWPMLIEGDILGVTDIVVVDDAGLPDPPFAVKV